VRSSPAATFPCLASGPRSAGSCLPTTTGSASAPRGRPSYATDSRFGRSVHANRSIPSPWPTPSSGGTARLEGTASGAHRHLVPMMMKTQLTPG
jgi:hypothetical protein